MKAAQHSKVESARSPAITTRPGVSHAQLARICLHVPNTSENRCSAPRCRHRAAEASQSGTRRATRVLGNHPESPHRLLDHRLPFRRAWRLSLGRRDAVRRHARMQAVELLDVSDPAGLDEASVPLSDVVLNLGIGCHLFSPRRRSSERRRLRGKQRQTGALAQPDRTSSRTIGTKTSRNLRSISIAQA